MCNAIDYDFPYMHMITRLYKLAKTFTEILHLFVRVCKHPNNLLSQSEKIIFLEIGPNV